MSTHTIRRAPASRIVRVQGPVDHDLALLWGLARRKFEARTGASPETRDDWRAVTRDYHALTTKQRVALGTRLRERCAEAKPGGT